MKITNCPSCDSDNLGSQWWGGGRLLVQYCYQCGWRSEPEEPYQKEVVSVKRVTVGRFAGWSYEVYDRYGWVMIYSQTYNNEKDAQESLERDMERGKKDPEAGPYTGILWPPYVEIKGKVFT